MKKEPISEIDDKTKFYRGTRFRKYEVGLNVVNPEDDFYEYMLTIVPGESEYLLLTCVEGYKAGNPLAFVKTEPNKWFVTAKSLKWSMGIENVYLLKEE